MKSQTKRFGALVAAAIIAFAVFTCLFTVFVGYTPAAAAVDNSGKYYYSRLSADPLAQNFYNAFATLFENGTFKNGTLEYDLVENGVATEEQIQAYVGGLDDSRLVKAYGAG
ncbi:MAG: hypothetical protein K2M36_02520, partial [Clostridia bacterium]|nr:hypothetical protein [Clostridia bacterium]